MNMNFTNIGASANAMKKVMHRPNVMLNLFQKNDNTGNGSLNAGKRVAKKESDLATITGRGKLINIVA